MLRTTVTRIRSLGSRLVLSLSATPGLAALSPILRLPSSTQAHVGLRLRLAASVSFDFYDQAIAAAVAGQGVALGRAPLVDHLLARGALVAPLAQEEVSPRGHFLVVNPESRVRPEVRAFEAWLLDQARAVRLYYLRRD